MAKPLYSYLRNVASYTVLQSKQVKVTTDYIKQNAYRPIPTYANTIYVFGAELYAFGEEKEQIKAILQPLRAYLEIEEPVLVPILDKLFIKSQKVAIGVKAFGQGLLPYVYTDKIGDIFVINTLPHTRLTIQIKEEEGQESVLFDYDASVVANSFRLFLSLWPDNVKQFEKLVYQHIDDYTNAMLKWLRTNFVYSFDGRLDTVEKKVVSTHICLHYLYGMQFFPKYHKQLLKQIDQKIASMYGLTKAEVTEILDTYDLSLEPKDRPFLTLEDLVNLHVEAKIVPAKVSDLSISVKLLRFTLYGLYLFGSIAGYAAMSVAIAKKINIVAIRLFRDIKPFFEQIGNTYYNQITTI